MISLPSLSGKRTSKGGSVLIWLALAVLLFSIFALKYRVMDSTSARSRVIHPFRKQNTKLRLILCVPYIAVHYASGEEYARRRIGGESIGKNRFIQKRNLVRKCRRRPWRDR